MLSDVIAPGWDVSFAASGASASRATELDAFLAVLRDEEHRLPSAERVNTMLMITRLRKLFYGAGGWDEHLIPGAAEVPPLYPFTLTDPVRRSLEIPGPNVIAFVDTRPHLDGARPELVRPGDLQDVLLPDGEVVDIGHVLAGLDSINHPATVAAPLGMYEMSSNVDAVTWAGDFGSVLAEVVFQEFGLRRQLTDNEIQAQIEACAPPQDMLGNIDAYVIGAAFDISSSAGRSVSDILLEYYGAPATAGSPRSRRFTIFALEIGLGPLEGDAFAMERAWRERYEREIAHAAALYVGATSRLSRWALPYAIGAKLALMKKTSETTLRHALLERFIAALRDEVVREAAQL